MRINIEDLSGVALDWAVAQLEQQPVYWHPEDGALYMGEGPTGDYSYAPSTNWAQGGPIVDENSWMFVRAENKTNGPWEHRSGIASTGETLLVAGLRAYVSGSFHAYVSGSYLGQGYGTDRWVEVPDEIGKHSLQSLGR